MANYTRLDRILILGALAAGASACVAPTSTPRPPLLPTGTMSPSTTPTSSPTPTPTKTPIPPTATIETPDILAEFLIDPVALRVDRLDSMPAIDFNIDEISLHDGTLKVEGQGWKGGLLSRATYAEGYGAMFDFKIDQDQTTPKFEFEARLDSGQWATDSYRSFGVYIKPTPLSELWFGKATGRQKYLVGDLKIQPAAWYRLFIAVGTGGDFLAVVWDPNNPDARRSYRVPMGGEWSGLHWKLGIDGAEGTMIVDNLTDISFQSIR